MLNREDMIFRFSPDGAAKCALRDFRRSEARPEDQYHSLSLTKSRDTGQWTAGSRLTSVEAGAVVYRLPVTIFDEDRSSDDSRESTCRV